VLFDFPPTKPLLYKRPYLFYKLPDDENLSADVAAGNASVVNAE
jgi:hypothetical protein